MLLNALRGGEHLSLPDLDELEQKGEEIRGEIQSNKKTADKLAKAKDLLKKTSAQNNDRLYEA